ncbi:CRISPR system precrRNA processing endoribonuclease RAMP protein Cas6 [Tepidimonas taiwanensis]|uniref:CRISPR system precrRNA processing endoribonuclease RAMP protein Cas6 n=1 Tax=Tepidimonas taiwanensis TaxID=307486 RepID=UPI0009DFF19A
MIRDATPGGCQLVIECLTPVAWKDHNQWATQAPTFAQWVRRILGRTAQLCESAGVANPIGHTRARAYLQLSEHVSAVDARQRPLWLQRTSRRSGHTMRVPTQLGRFVYSGPVADFAPLLRWAEALQVGAKTAFGCGVIRWQFLGVPEKSLQQNRKLSLQASPKITRAVAEYERCFAPHQ